MKPNELTAILHLEYERHTLTAQRIRNFHGKQRRGMMLAELFEGIAETLNKKILAMERKGAKKETQWTT